ncbi:MAG TPA: Crp/Fnr family transcriptional regulator [Sphingobium sp.]|nr:Crp/Fnr family transcriptional regulator [Sphingobium sp.]
MNNSERASALRLLRSVDWLRDYPAALAEELLAHGRLIHLGTGQWAQAQGDDRGGLFIVIDGLFHSYCTAPGDRQVMIGLSGPGSVLGHATKFSGGPRLVTAISVRPSILLEISEHALEHIAGHRPEIWRAIADFAYANMRRTLHMLAELMALPPRQRIASRLLAAAVASDKGLIVSLSQQTLAEMIGISRKTVNLHLSAFERAGLIRLGYGSIELVDSEALREVAIKE